VVFNPNDQVWVAQGVYYPIPPPPVGPPTAVDQTATFIIPAEVEVYGGFIGNELSVILRAGNVSKTILSGDIDLSGTLTATDSDTVVTFAVPPPAAATPSRLDGFTIQFGSADGTNPGLGLVGGGVVIPAGTDQRPPLLDEVTIENCTAVSGGGGLYSNGSFGAKFCTIRACTAGSADYGPGRGAGMLLEQIPVPGSEPPTNVPLLAFLASVEVNTCRAWLGGGIHLDFIDQLNGQLWAQNVLLHNNGAHYGGAVFVATDDGSTEFTNATIVNNMTASAPGAPAMGGGAGIWYQTAITSTFTARVNNSIVWGNVHSAAGAMSPSSLDGPGAAPAGGIRVWYSDIEVAGGGVFQLGQANINANPLFINATLLMFSLDVTSPCIDAADDTRLQADYVDLDEMPVTIGPVPFEFRISRARELVVLALPPGQEVSPPAGVNDMGAFEFDVNLGN